MGLIKNNTGLEEIKESVANVENTSTEIKANINEVKTDTEGIVLSNESIKAIVDEIQNRIGLTGDTGGSASAGSVMSKLNQIIGSAGSGGGGGWEIPRIKSILTPGSHKLSNIGMQPNTNYRLLIVPISFSSTATTEVSVGSYDDYKFKFYINDVDVYPTRTGDVLILPMCVPFNFKISTLSYTPKFFINGCFIFWLEDTSE